MKMKMTTKSRRTMGRLRHVWMVCTRRHRITPIVTKKRLDQYRDWS
jgi:hypothetical protein